MHPRSTLEVDCYAGHRGEETPRVLHFGSRTTVVTRVLDRWHGPDHRYFKVEGDDGARYLLRHDEGQGCWELIVYHRGGPPDFLGPL